MNERTDADGRTPPMQTAAADAADAEGRTQHARRIGAADEQRILPFPHLLHLLDIALEKFAARRTGDGGG